VHLVSVMDFTSNCWSKVIVTFTNVDNVLHLQLLDSSQLVVAQVCIPVWDAVLQLFLYFFSNANIPLSTSSV
jgi:hypothetical protein